MSRRRLQVPYGANLFSCYSVFCYGYMLAYVLLDLVFPY